ncbi:MAG TPA: hypothetical protein VFC31_10875 [Candidatus Limnocylindria bacterium]|nr:hypothetical protein [Candidatus Limnocylindria bacterium]
MHWIGAILRRSAGAPTWEMFEPVGTGEARVSSEISYEPRDAAEKVGDALGEVERGSGSRT